MNKKLFFFAVTCFASIPILPGEKKEAFHCKLFEEKDYIATKIVVLPNQSAIIPADLLTEKNVNTVRVLYFGVTLSYYLLRKHMEIFNRLKQ